MQLHKWTALATILFFSSFGWALTKSSSPSPVGETANYDVVKNSRTSSLITSGSAKTSVSQYIPDAADGPSYEIVADYKANIVLRGEYQGTEKVNVPEQYFTEEFLESIRQSGHYETTDFKVEHLGFQDATNKDGHTYTHCDYMRFYDINVSKAPSFINFFLLAAYGDLTGAVQRDVEDLQIWVKVRPEIPVLGAVQIDISGKVSGMKAKAGFDYLAPM